jgi:hypothetical protein
MTEQELLVDFLRRLNCAEISYYLKTEAYLRYSIECSGEGRSSPRVPLGIGDA